MKTVKVEISKASLTDLCEKACETHKQALMELDNMYDIKCVVECLADVLRLWEATDENFDADDDLLLTIEKRKEEKENGSDD